MSLFGDPTCPVSDVAAFLERHRAANWRWSPTWHRLFPPPTANGSWDGHTRQEVKDRWVYPLRRDPDRDEILRVKDARAEGQEVVRGASASARRAMRSLP